MIFETELIFDKLFRTNTELNELINVHNFQRNFISQFIKLFFLTMKHFHDDWIQEWCDTNGWTDLIRERYNGYWAFPPNAVMPEPIPRKVLQIIKDKKGLSNDEQLWLASAGLLSIIAIALCFLIANPMPIVLAFAFDAITVAQLEVEGI